MIKIKKYKSIFLNIIKQFCLRAKRITGNGMK